MSLQFDSSNIAINYVPKLKSHVDTSRHMMKCSLPNSTIIQETAKTNSVSGVDFKTLLGTASQDKDGIGDFLNTLKGNKLTSLFLAAIAIGGVTLKSISSRKNHLLDMGLRAHQG